MSYYVTYRKPNNEVSVGLALRDQQSILDLPSAVEFLVGQGKIERGIVVPNTMIEFIEAQPALGHAMEVVVASAADEALQPYVFAESDVKLMAPIPRPKKNVFAVGLNYREHNTEFTGSEDLPKYPIFFSKGPNSVTGPDDAVESYPQYTQQLDYEAELAIVIGKQGKDIPKDEVQDYIFGYTIINDISVRDRQKRTSQWFIGKTMDTHCPMGPYLADKNEIPWPVELEIMSRVNGEERQHSNTSLLLFDIPTIVSVISEGTTLEPGDVIATGTCAGVGLGYNPPRFMKKGDVVEIEIEKLGILRNHIV